MEALTSRTYIGAKEARERGLLAGRTARCECGRTCPSGGTAPGYTEIPFFQYRGLGSQEAEETCVCGKYRVAHGAHAANQGRYACDDFRLRGPSEFDSFYCGCRGWD
jgi:hypothetical protein